MQNLSRRDFIAAAGALGGAVLLGGCGDSETGVQPGRDAEAPGGDRRRARQAVDPRVGRLRGRRPQGAEVRPLRRHAVHEGVRRRRALLHLHRQRQPVAPEVGHRRPVRHHAPLHPDGPVVRRAGARAAVGSRAARELRQPRPVPAGEGPGRRQAVHDPVGLGLRQPALPHRHGRRRGRHQLGPRLEREVQGQDRALERQLVELRDDRRSSSASRRSTT